LPNPSRLDYYLLLITSKQQSAYSNPNLGDAVYFIFKL